MPVAKQLNEHPVSHARGYAWSDGNESVAT